MSYKASVLSDMPIMLYSSNDITLNPMLTYQDVIDSFATYQDLENEYPGYRYLAGSFLKDLSPCMNNGSYVGAIDTTNPPLVYGDEFALRVDIDNYISASVTNDYSGQDIGNSFGTLGSSDNDFSLEIWVYPSITSGDEAIIFADSTNDIGLFYNNGTIVFKVGSEQISWSMPYLKKAVHLVATYTVNSIMLYADGTLESFKLLTGFKFTNDTLSLTCGPTQNSSDYMLVNGIAAYRYALSESLIKAHYSYAQSIPAFQIAIPDDATMFDLYDTNISTQYLYSYPANRSWSSLVVDGIKYNSQKDALEVIVGLGDAQEIIIEDVISVPTGPEMDDSRIEWEGDNGIEIWTKAHEEDDYVQCTNGLSIPQYNLSSFDTDRTVYLKIIFNTTDDSIHIPQLSQITISFYNNQTVYAKNSGSYITSDTEINLSNGRYPILSKDSRNGLVIGQDCSFDITHSRDIKTVEFFIIPSEIPASGNIFNLIAFSSGVLNTAQSGYPSVYINGLDVSDETDINTLFFKDELAHVTLVYTSAVSETPKFELPGTYQNICLYDYEFDQAKVTQHYQLWTGSSGITVSDSSLSMTENSVHTYNNDWLVIQNV